MTYISYAILKTFLEVSRTYSRDLKGALGQGTEGSLAHLELCPYDARSTGHSQIDIICESILITSWSKWLKNLMFYGAMITLH